MGVGTAAATNPSNSMSSAGLSRRRVANTSSSHVDDEAAPSRNGSVRKSTPPMNHSAATHAGSAFEGGSRIAFDPRDLTQDATEEAKVGGKMPRLTIMEEVLLLGIKDKQVPLLVDATFYMS